MKKSIKLLAFCLAFAFCLPLFAGCSGGQGKTMMTLSKDGITVTMSVNLYELMLTRTKGTLTASGVTAGGATPAQDSFWNYTEKFDGTNVETIDEYYSQKILENCKIYLAASYLFKKEGLALSDAQKADIEERLDEHLKTDGDGSKTKLNAVLANYGINYDLLRMAYELEAMLEAVQTHYYGKNGELVGHQLKDQFLAENYAHFKLIRLDSTVNVFESDKNGDTVYYKNGGKEIAYDTQNGYQSTEVDSTGKNIYYIKDADGNPTGRIAYDMVNGEPVLKMSSDGKSYETRKMTESELTALKTKAEALYEQLKNSDAAAFEEAMAKNEEERTQNASVCGYTGDVYAQTKTAYGTAVDDILAALTTMQNGEVKLLKADDGYYYLYKKYGTDSKAYEKEENEVWFETFNKDLTEQLFMKKCEEYFADIVINEKVYQKAPTMRDVGINYYY